MADSLEESHAALEEAERLYRGIFENAVEGIFIMDSDGLLLNVNPAFARLAGCEGPGEVLGTNIADHWVRMRVPFYSGNCGGQAASGVWRSTLSGATDDKDRNHIREGGPRQGGALVRVQGLLNDITEKKEIEEGAPQSAGGAAKVR
jgi:PAS domain-containing protein